MNSTVRQEHKKTWFIYRNVITNKYYILNLLEKWHQVKESISHMTTISPFIITYLDHVFLLFVYKDNIWWNNLASLMVHAWFINFDYFLIAYHESIVRCFVVVIAVTYTLLLQQCIKTMQIVYFEFVTGYCSFNCFDWTLLFQTWSKHYFHIIFVNVILLWKTLRPCILIQMSIL